MESGDNLKARGFILVIVVALLGVMAILAVNLAGQASIARNLSVQSVLQSRARQMARSGFEIAATNINSGVRIPPSETFELSIGLGTRCPSGDLVRMDWWGTNNCIHLNDGIAGGRQELGSDYSASALDPYPFQGQVAVESSVGTYFSAPLAPPNGMAFIQTMSPSGDVLVGDIITVGSWVGKIISISPIGATTWYRLETLDYAGPSPLNYSVVRDFYGVDKSAIINLRLRHLLNAYGDIHLFLSQIGMPSASSFGTDEFFPTSSCADPLSISQPGGKGFGDHVIAARPPSGYMTHESVAEVVDSWARERLADNSLQDDYLNGQSFYEICRRDLTLEAWQDAGQKRLLQPLTETWNHVTDNYRTGSLPLIKQVAFRSLFGQPIDFRSLFGPTTVTPVNFDGASFAVKAALLAAPMNVEYLVEGAETLLGIDEKVNVETFHNLRTRSTAIGSALPVFDSARITENGRIEGGQAARLMSFRDALEVATYLQSYGPVVSFDGLGFAIREYRQACFLAGETPFEKAQPQIDAFLPRNGFDPHPISGGQFMQDYVEVALPHLLSGIRRIPGFMGAPQALLSPYLETDPRLAAGLNPLPQIPGFVPGMRRSVEDLVRRIHLPKVIFHSGGSFQIESIGLINAESGTPVARASIRATIRGLEFETLRSQADLEAFADREKTSLQMLVGPNRTEFTSFGDSEGPVAAGPDPVFGFIGLQDRPIQPSLNSQIVMNFNKDANLSDSSRSYPFPDTSLGFSPYLNRNAPQDPFLDPFLDLVGPTGYEPNGIMTDPLRNSAMEPVETPFMWNGANGGDLSPFGGCFFGVMHHGTGQDIQSWSGINFSDSLYWRLQDVSPQSIVGNQPALGAGKGVVHLWVRLPSGYDLPFPGPQSVQNPYPIYPSNAFLHQIFSLDVWNGGFNASQHYQAKVALAYRYEPEIARRTLVARFERMTTVNVNQTQSYNYFASEDYPLLPYVNDPLLNPQVDVMGLHPPEETAYSRWTNPFNTGAYEHKIVFKDLPEAGPGTWHKITLGWNVNSREAGDAPSGWGWGSWPYVNRLWLKLHKAVLIDYEEYRFLDYFSNSGIMPGGVGGGVAPPTPLSPDELIGWKRNNSNSVFSLGEKHARGDDPSIYFPIWRLDSCVDNLEASFGDVPVEFFGPTASGYGGATNLRYDLRPIGAPSGKNEPSICFDTKAAGSQIIEVGARIYNPLDSRAGTLNGPNFPRIEIDVADINALGGPAVHPSIATGGGTHLSLFAPIAPDTRVRLTYKAENPNGNPLIVSDEDAWTEIPWICEVHWGIRPVGGIRILRWEVD